MQAKIELIFVELLCYDPEIIEHNILETKLTSPDYVGKRMLSYSQGTHLTHTQRQTRLLKIS